MSVLAAGDRTGDETPDPNIPVTHPVTHRTDVPVTREGARP